MNLRGKEAMQKWTLGLLVVAVVFVDWSSQLRAQAGQATDGGASSANGLPLPLLRWPVLPGNEAYSAIDGRRLHRHVVEQAEISRRYRDRGNAHFWGRIMGTWADEESVRWFLAKFKEIGLSDVYAQPLNLAPKWFPEPWEVTVTAGGKTLPLVTARPGYRSPATPPEGLDLEVVQVGLGSEADFGGRDVRGKAVVIFNPFRTGPAPGAQQRAEAKGAAAIFVADGQPGNLQVQYTSGNTVPNFSLGNDDGNMVRDLIGQTLGGRAPRMRIRLAAKEVPNLKSAIVWGTLPGATDELIHVLAHRDGWFDAGINNGSGIATMIGLAEYFAKIPQAQRRRTMVFLATDGHHFPGPRSKEDPTGEGGEGEGRTLLRLQGERGAPWVAKTALFINCEHTSGLVAHMGSARIALTNYNTPHNWYAGGPSRPRLQALAARVFAEFGVATYAEPTGQKPPGGELGFFYHMTPGLTSAGQFHFFHTDRDTPENVSWTGLEATTRAYAKMIDEVNKIDLKDLYRPREARPDELVPEAIKRALSQPPPK